eukprot:6641668-Alexandrium_andersonii.AAC.1
MGGGALQPPRGHVVKAPSPLGVQTAQPQLGRSQLRETGSGTSGLDPLSQDSSRPRCWSPRWT